MADPGADRHLVFGLLTFQNGPIDQGQLVAAFQAWARGRSRALAEYLSGRGDRAAVEALVARHLTPIAPEWLLSFRFHCREARQ